MSYPQTGCLGQKEKNKNKRCLCFDQGLGSAPDLSTLWKYAVMMLGVGESSGDKQLCVGKVAGSQGRGLGFPESFCRHLRAAELPSANENQKQGPGNLGWGMGRRETHALGAPGLGCRKQEGRGMLSEEPANPDMGNGATLSRFLLCCLLSGPESRKETVPRHQSH